MLLGIGTYTFTWAIGVPGYPKTDKPMDAFELIRQAHEYGVSVVQICDNLPLHTLSNEELTEIRDMADSLHIQLEIGTRGVEPDHLMKYLEICKLMNSDILRTIVQKDNGYVGIEEAAKLIKEVIHAFEKEEVYLAIENHERHKVKELISLIKAIDSPFAGICLDTVNSFGALEGPDYVIRELAPYTINLHVKDFVISRLDHNMGFELKGAPAGSGQLDLDYAAKALKSHGRDPSVILELWTPFTGDIETTVQKEKDWADQSIKFLKEWVK